MRQSFSVDAELTGSSEGGRLRGQRGPRVEARGAGVSAALESLSRHTGKGKSLHVRDSTFSTQSPKNLDRG